MYFLSNLSQGKVGLQPPRSHGFSGVIAIETKHTWTLLHAWISSSSDLYVITVFVPC